MAFNEAAVGLAEAVWGCVRRHHALYDAFYANPAPPSATTLDRTSPVPVSPIRATAGASFATAGPASGSASPTTGGSGSPAPRRTRAPCGFVPVSCLVPFTVRCGRKITTRARALLLEMASSSNARVVEFIASESDLPKQLAVVLSSLFKMVTTTTVTITIHPSFAAAHGLQSHSLPCPCPCPCNRTRARAASFCVASSAWRSSCMTLHW